MNPTPPRSRSAPRTAPVLLALLATLAACSGRALPAPPAPTAPALGGLAPEQEAFWTRLAALCGTAFEGRVRMAPEGDDWWDADRVVMHVRECGESEIRIPLHIDQNRSRTWVVTRTAEGLRLKHDHRLPSGEPDTANTQYGGDTVVPGTIWRQEFPADAYSVGVVAARASQLWYLELRPGRDFAYGLRREATGMRYHLEFDLTRPVEPPPPPWGARQRTAQQ